MTMLRVFPKHRSEWLRVLLFPFQAYVVLGHCATVYLLSIWRFRNVSPLNHFADQLLIGYVLSFLVLLPVGLYQRHLGYRARGYLNIGLALWAIVSIAIPGWVQA